MQISIAVHAFYRNILLLLFGITLSAANTGIVFADIDQKTVGEHGLTPVARRNNQAWVRDSDTGLGIASAQITFYRVGTNRSVSQVVTMDKGGRKSFKLEDGLYLYEVSAPGYRPLRDYFEESAPATFANAIMLDSENAAPKFPAAMEGHMAIGGYVVDVATGGPLPSARIHADDGTIGTVSDEEGYFTLYIPVAPSSAEADDETAEETEADIIVEAAGHKTQVLRHNSISAGDAGLFIIDMQPGRGRLEKDNRHKLSKKAVAPKEAPQSAQPNATAKPLPKEILEWMHQRDGSSLNILESPNAPQSLAMNVPLKIKVGFNCPSPRTCSRMQEYSLEKYVAWGWMMNGLSHGI